MLFALAMPMLIGRLGVGFEVSNWYWTQRGMQSAAEAAARCASARPTVCSSAATTVAYGIVESHFWPTRTMPSFSIV